MIEPIEIAQENAHRNYMLLTKQLPKHLAQREDQLFQKISNHKGNALTKLKAVYQLMDEIYAFVSKFTPCKKGCNFCCHYPVSISELEIEFIEKSSNIKRLKNPRPDTNFHGTPCPFLKSGTCSIYQIRPFVCRQHVALTKTSIWCHPDQCNSVELILLKFTEITKSYSYIINENRKATRYDIRQIFEY